MDRKAYMRDIYSRYWIDAREKIYGFPDYDRNLCEYICNHVSNPGKILEVAVGTGYPFADFLQKEGYTVYGIDIAPNLVKKCQDLYPDVICKVGDAENLDFPDDLFDCTYCFHSTWVFQDLKRVIHEMLRVTRPGGRVIFDIQNKNNSDIENAFQKRVRREGGVGKIIRWSKNIIKLLLRKGPVVWNYEVHETPTYPESIYMHLKELDIKEWKVMARTKEEKIEIKESAPLEKYARLIFVVNVPEL